MRRRRLLAVVYLTILLSLPACWFRAASDQPNLILSAILVIFVNLTISVFMIYRHDEFIENIILGIFKYDEEKKISKEELEEWREWKRLNALDQKLQTGHYTNAEKETFLYTAQLRPENKEYLRSKHLPPKNSKNTPIQQ